jgi:hypothetical protein
MMTTQEKIDALNLIQRLEVRCGCMRLEFKQSGHQRKNDMDTMLTQLEILKRTISDVPVNA